MSDPEKRQASRTGLEVLRLERRLKALADRDDEAVFVCDREGRILFSNPKLAEFVGIPPDGIRNLRLEDLPTCFQSEKAQALRDALREKRYWMGRISGTHPAGRPCEVIARVQPIPENEELLVVIHDVLREAELEQQARQAQKMEAIGRLAGGIAHDFNNILTSIIGFAQLIPEQLPKDHPCAHDVAEILNAAQHASQLTRQLLLFSRKQPVTRRPVDLQALLFRLDRLFRQTLPENIELVTLPPDNPVYILGDEASLEQAILNLVINARDAMPNGGTLTLTVHEEYRAPFQTPNLGESEVAYAVLVVRDTGVGMDDHVRSHLFEPFFTTKEKGHGTGLGLSIVYSIIRQFDGFIEVDTAPGKGTEFRLYLPVALGDLHVAPPSQAAEPPRLGHERILVVEDEQSLRTLLSRILQSRGYRVTEARNGEEGLRVFRQTRPPPDLILTDIIMPKMSGPEMVEQLRKTVPNIKVLFMSGFIGESGGNVEARLGAPLLTKPFTADHLAREVRRVLDAQPPGSP